MALSMQHAEALPDRALFFRICYTQQLYRLAIGMYGAG